MFQPYYYQICQRIKTGSWFVGHVANEGSYITKDDQWASFNDVVDVEEKSRWIKSSGLGGASVFGLHEEDSEDVCGAAEDSRSSKLLIKFSRGACFPIRKLRIAL